MSKFFILIFLSGCHLNTELATQNKMAGAAIAPKALVAPPEACPIEPTAFHCGVKLVSVYDGDTFKVDLSGVHPFFGANESVRIYGIDTPEMKTKDPCEAKKAIEAKQFMESLLVNAKKIELVDIKKDKFFRILAKVFADGQDVAKLIIGKQLARPYFGDTKSKTSWCK